jgi:hypothetical protein
VDKFFKKQKSLSRQGGVMFYYALFTEKKPSLAITIVSTVLILLSTAWIGFFTVELLKESVGEMLAYVAGIVLFLVFFVPTSFGVWSMYLFDDKKSK